MTIFNFISVLVLMTSTCQAISWNEQGTKGWLWYKATPKKPIPSKQPEKKDLPNSISSDKDVKVITYRDRLKKEQEEFEEIQARAVMEPTLQNVQAFQKTQNLLMNQSENFGKIWMLASLLDARSYSESSNPYPVHRQVYKEKEDKKLDQRIKKFSKSFGLFFIFKKECPYCHQFAPIVREFIDTYGFNYKAISPDGSPLPEFPDSVADNGAIQTINQEGIYPALYLVNPQTRDVIPLARGLVNITELRSNMKLIMDSVLGGKSNG